MVPPDTVEQARRLLDLAREALGHPHRQVLVPSTLARALAEALLAGQWDRPGLIGRGSVVLRRRAQWMPALVDQVLAA